MTLLLLLTLLVQSAFAADTPTTPPAVAAAPDAAVCAEAWEKLDLHIPHWLEEDGAQRTKWQNDEQHITNDYFAKNKSRAYWEQFLKKLFDVETTKSAKEGKTLRLSVIDHGMTNPIDDVVLEKDGTKKVILSTSEFAHNGSVEVVGTQISPTEDRVLVFLADKGSLDRHRIVVKKVGQNQTEEVINIAQPDIVWLSNDEFVYPLYNSDTGKGGTYRHKIGTPQSADTVFAEGESAANTPSNRWVSYVSDGKNEKSTLTDTTSGQQFAFDGSVETLLGESGNKVIGRSGGKNGFRELVSIETDANGKAIRKVIVPETDMVLNSVHMDGDHIIANYGFDKKRVIRVFDLDGKQVASMDMPGYAAFAPIRKDMYNSVEDVHYDAAKNQLKMNLVSPVQTAKPFTYDVKTGKFIEGDPRETLLTKDGVQYVVEYVETKSADGTTVPIRITRRADVKLDGSAPALIEGYGGFASTAYYYPTNYQPIQTEWMRNGGIHVAPALRGGLERGPDWHKQAMFEHKQNVMNDVFATSTWLRDNKYSSPERTGIMGFSNGGLVMGSSATERTDLFGAAVVGAGVDNTLRATRLDPEFGGWSYEYGDGKKPKEAAYIRPYSSVQVAMTPKKYPAIMAIAGRNDSRVNHAHSDELIWVLRQTQRGPKPVLLSTLKNSGHWLSKPDFQGWIAWHASVQIWSLFSDELGLVIKP